MAERNYPDFITAYLDFTKEQEASIKVHTWVAISILAASMERKVFLNRGHYTLFPNLYTFIIGPSGIIRKSTSTGIGVSLLRELEGISVMAERMTAASLIQQMARSGRTFKVGQEDQSQSAVFAYASELVVMMREVYGSISDLLTTFYDCSPHDCRKPWTYETKGDGEIKVFGPCLNILGASTSAWLAEAIPPDQMEGGFASRVIFVVDNSPPERIIAWPQANHAINEIRPKLVADLKQIHALAGSVQVSPEARAWYETWYAKYKADISSAAGDLRFSGYYGRKSDTLLKLAIVCSVSASDDLILRQEHLERACAFLESLEINMFQAFGTTGKNEMAVDLQRVWSLIFHQRRIAHADILRQYSSDLNHKTLLEIITMLREMNLIESQVISSRIWYTAKKGAKKDFWLADEVETILEPKPRTEPSAHLHVPS